MTVELLYLDTSAIVKLVRPEAESRALAKRLAAPPWLVSSLLAQVEVGRAVTRFGRPASLVRAAIAVLDRIALRRIDRAIVSHAASLGPADLRALDAIHLATALSLGPRLTAVITYDTRLARAASSAGLVVESPS